MTTDQRLWQKNSSGGLCRVNLNFEALGEREREGEATRDEIPETVTSFWRQMTRVREGDWQLKLPLEQVRGERESIILGFCLTHFDQNGRGRRGRRKKEAKLSCSTHTGHSLFSRAVVVRKGEVA